MFSPTRLVGLAEQDLFKLNMLLAEAGLPFYYLGGTKFNPDYRFYPTPRFVFTWRPPFTKIQQIYLSYLPESENQKDIVYDADWFELKITSK